MEETVSVETMFGSEAFPTFVAHEWLLPTLIVIMRLKMSLKITLIMEGFATLTALIRFFPRV